jgi:RecA/RadA recombinase
MESVLKELGIKILSSGLECYDRLLYNGVPCGMITVDCGKTQSFKTLLNLQKAYSFINQTKSNVLFVDTEGGLLITIAGWKQKFEKRFNLERTGVLCANYALNKEKDSVWLLDGGVESENGNIIVATVRDLFKLYEIHGSPIDLKISEEAGKFDVIRKPFRYSQKGQTKEIKEELPIEETPIGRLITSYNITAVIYDSLIELFKQRIPATRYNFPCRATLLHMLLGSMQRIAETWNIPVIGITHTSRDPADPKKKRETPSALNVISYNCKGMTLLRVPYENPESVQIFNRLNQRQLTIWRHQYKAPLSETYTIQLTDKGLIEAE